MFLFEVCCLCSKCTVSGEGYLVAPPLLLNLTGPFKAARPVITRWCKGAVQCLHMARDDR